MTSATNRSALNTPEPVPHDQEEEYLIPLVTIKEEVRVNRSAPPPSQPSARNQAPRPVMTPRVRYYSERELQQLHNRAIHAHSTSSRYAGMFLFQIFIFFLNYLISFPILGLTDLGLGPRDKHYNVLGDIMLELR